MAVHSGRRRLRQTVFPGTSLCLLAEVWSIVFIKPGDSEEIIGVTGLHVLLDVCIASLIRDAN